MGKNAVGTLITSSGQIKDLVFEGNMASLKEMQDCVDGYIEFVFLSDSKILVVNEDGKIKGLESNIIATLLIQEQGMNDSIVGNALLIDRKYVD